MVKKRTERNGMGRHLNCGGDFGAERRCFGELSKKQDGDMDNLKVLGQLTKNDIKQKRAELVGTRGRKRAGLTEDSVALYNTGDIPGSCPV